MMKGGNMYDLDLVKINRSLVKSIRILGAVRRMVGKGGEGYSELQDVEREIREGAAECQRVLVLIKEDVNRPLISG